MQRLPDDVLKAMFAQARAIAAACRQHTAGMLDAQDAAGNLDLGDDAPAARETKRPCLCGQGLSWADASLPSHVRKPS